LHTVGTGDMTMHQFTQALGTGILATASAVGLSFRDIGAAIATLTDNAIPADQAATKLRTSMLMMVNPSGPATAALNSIGMAATSLAMDMQKPDGLKVALDDIRTHLDHAFPKNQGVALSIDAQRAAVNSYRDTLITTGVAGKELDKMVAKYTVSLKHGTTNTVLQEQAFAKMFGGSKNAGTMMVLFNEQLDRMNPKLASYGDATSRAAEMQAAWAKQQDTFKQKLHELGASVDVAKVKIGNELLPVLKDIVGWMDQHTGVVKTLAFVIGGALVAATAAWTAQILINTAALLANPIGLIVIALAAVAVAFVETWKHSQTFRDILVASLSASAAMAAKFLGMAIDTFRWFGDTTLNVVSGVIKGLYVLAKVHDAFFGGDWGAKLKGASADVDVFHTAFDSSMDKTKKSVADMALQAGTSLSLLAAHTAGSSASAGASVAQMASHITNSIGSLNGLHAAMTVDANGNVNINDMGLTHQQIADFHGVANGGIFQAGQKVFADGGMLPSAATIQPATGTRGLIQWAEPETHGEAFIPLAPAKRARSLNIWEKTGKLLGAFADGGITVDFHDNVSGPIDKGLAEFVKDAIATVRHLASKTMKQVQGAYNAQTFGGASSNDIINFAESFVGKVPYVWGGTTPQGWDCSGFTSYVYDHFGIGAPRTSEAQQGWARPSGEVPGALAFFGNPAHHVGIALGGRKMVNAEHPGSLTMNDNLWSDFSGFGLPPQGLGAAGAVAGGFGGSTNEAVFQALKLNGLPASLSGIVLRQIQTESGGNANAVQGIVDVNSGNGGANLARGIMQVIPATFAAYHVPGTSNNIFDLLANISAGINYAKNRYGPGLGYLGQGHGYASGGMPEVGRPYWTGENGPELQMALGPTRVFSHEDSKAMTRNGVTIAGDLHVHGDTDVDLLAHKLDFMSRAGHFG